MRRSKFGDWRHVFDLCNAQLSYLHYWLRSMAQMPIDLPSTDDLILVVYGLYLTFPLNQVRFPDEDNEPTQIDSRLGLDSAVGGCNRIAESARIRC